FACAYIDMRPVALFCCRKAILERHHILERRGIFANPSTARAREITSVQRLELKHRGELLRATQFMADHVSRDFRCKRERKSHRSDDSNEECQCVNGRELSSKCAKSNRVRPLIRI